MGNVCSSVKLLFSELNNYLDLLIVCDEYDSIKLCMNGIKSLLQPTKLNRIKHRSIFDYEHEKQTILCNKVLFLIADSESRQYVGRWVQELPKIKGDADKYLVLCLQENVDIDANQISNTPVYRSNDVMSWLPDVLRFIYGTTNNYPRKSGADLCLVESVSETQRFTDFKPHLKTSLQRLTTTTEHINQDCKAVVYVCNDLGENIESTIKTKLRQVKLYGNHVYVIAFSYSKSISEDIQWVATHTYTRNETTMFLLHLMTRLGLLDTREEFVIVPKTPNSPLSDIKISDTALSLKQVRIEWKINYDTCFKGKLTIQHRTDMSKQWDQLVSNLSLETTSSYRISDLDTDRKHQFRLIWSTKDGDCNPTNSSWFSWKMYHKGRLALKIVLYFIAFAIGVFTIPQFLICFLCCFPLRESSEDILTDCFMLSAAICYCFLCFFGAVTMWVLYGVLQRDYDSFWDYPDGTYGYSHDGDIIWLLLGGFYLMFWCLVVHFVMLFHDFDLGSLQLTKVIYDKANEITSEYYVNEIDNPV